MKTNRRNPFSRHASLFTSGLLIFFSTLPSFSAIRDWSATAADTVWATGSNWVGGTAPANSLTTDDARFNQTSYTNQPNYGTRSITKLIFGDGTVTTAPITLDGTTLSVGGDITVNANSGTVDINGINQIGWGSFAATNNSASLLTIGTGLKSRGTGGVTTFTFNGSGKVLVSGPIGNGSGTNDVALTKSGAGTLTLAGTNTFTGGVSLSGATANSQLNLNSSTALGATASRLTITSGDNAKIDNTSVGAITIANNNPQSWDNNFTFVGTNDLNMGTGAVTMSGSRTITSSTAGKTLTLGGVISGSGFSFTKAGAGNVMLTGANAYTGGTLITGGRLHLNRAGGAAIKGNVSLSTSTNGVRPALYLQADNQLESTATISATIGGSNSVFTDLVLAGHSQTIAGYAASGKPTPTARSFIQNGILAGDAGAGVLTINNSSTVTLGGGTTSNQLEIRDNNTVGGGTLALVKDGSGTLALNLYAASYTGGFTLKNGLVQIAGTAFGSGTPLIFQGGSLSSSDTTARTFAIGNTVSLAGDVSLGNALNNGKLTFPGAATLTDNRTLTINSAVEFSSGLGEAATGKTLAKAGPGTLILGGTNTYTGDTSINAGRLDVAGSLTSNVTVAANTTIGGEGSIGSGSTLTFSPGSNTLAFDPSTSGGLTVPTIAITGATILVSPDSAVDNNVNYLVLTNSSGFGATVPPEFKAATRGTLSLANGNTELRFTAGVVQNLAWRGYTGANQTLWNIDGTANWDNSGSPDKFFNLDTVIFDDNAINTVVQITGSNVSPAGTTTFNHSTKNYTLGSSGSYGIATGNLTKTGTGTLTITNSNAYDGGTLLENGTININNADAIGSPAGALTFDSSLASGTPVPTLQLGATIASSSRNIVLATDGFIDTNGFDLTQTGAVSGASTLTKSGAGVLTLAAGNSYSGATVITGGTLSISSDGNLGTAPGSPTADKIVLSNGGKLSVSGSGATINANRQLTLNGTGGTLEATGTNNLIYRGIVTGSGALTLSMTGSGEGQFGAATSDYSGGTVIASGSKFVFFNSSTGSASTSNLTNGDFGTGTITMNTTSLRPTTSGARTIGNAVVLQGDLTVFAPGSGTPQALTFDGPITLTGASRTVTNNSGAALTFSGVVGDGSNNLGLVKTGANSLTLSNANTYGGGTNLQGTGSLNLTHSQALGSGGLLLQSTQTSTPTTLAISGGISVANPITMDSTTGRESITSSGTGNNAISGGITITGAGGNHLAISNSQTSGTLTVSGGINGAAYTGNVSLRGSLAGPNGFLNGTVNIASEFQQNGTTDWIVNCPGSIWTNTRIFGVGSILLGANNALATSAKVLWSSGATGAVDLAGYNQSVAGLDAAAVTTAKVTNNGTADKKLTLSGLAADYTFAGTITDGGTNKVSLEMNSTGRTQTLTGANTYTGSTTVSSGTLLLNGNQSLATGAVQVDGTLGGTGTVGGAVSVSATGTIAPGTSTGTFNVASADLTAGGTLAIEINDASTPKTDLLNVTGTLSVTGGKLNFLVTGTPTQTSYTIATAGTVTGTFAPANITNMPSGYALDYSTPGQIKLVKSGFTSWVSSATFNLPVEDQDPTDDPDGDGVNNITEFALDGNPASGASTGKVVGKVASVGGNQALVLSLPVRGTGTTFSAPGSPTNGELVSSTVDNLIYKIQSGDNLAAWILDVAEVPVGSDKSAIESTLPGLSSPEWTYRTFRSPGTVVGDPTEFIRAAVITTP